MKQKKDQKMKKNKREDNTLKYQKCLKIFQKDHEKKFLKTYKPRETKGAFNNDYMEYESRGDEHKNLSLEGYFNLMRIFLRDMINNHKNHGEWKIQLTMQITFIYSLDTGEFRIMR